MPTALFIAIKCLVYALKLKRGSALSSYLTIFTNFVSVEYFLFYCFAILKEALKLIR